MTKRSFFRSSLPKTSEATTLSPALRSIPFTPCEARPVSRTSASLNRMALPSSLTIMAFISPSVSMASRSSSPSVRFMAISPLLRIFTYWLNSVFFTRPFAVTMRILAFLALFTSSSLYESTEVTISLGLSERRFTIAFPFEIREP